MKPISFDKIIANHYEELYKSMCLYTNGEYLMSNSDIEDHIYDTFSLDTNQRCMWGCNEDEVFQMGVNLGLIDDIDYENFLMEFLLKIKV